MLHWVSGSPRAGRMVPRTRTLAVECFENRRLLASGALDLSFSGDGRQITSLGPRADEANAVAIQSDGKIVVGGYSYRDADGSKDFALVRYNTNGSLDTTFSGDGKATTPFGSGDDYITAIAIQPDGKIVAVGSAYNGTNYDFAVARFRTNGTLDPNFGNLGRTAFSVGSQHDYARGVAIDSNNGAILISGTAYVENTFDVALARLTQDGFFNGYVTTELGVGEDQGWGIAIQPDRKIVVVGSTFRSTGGHDFAVLRYHPGGGLDGSFGNGGKAIFPMGSRDDFAHAVTLQDDGKIVVAGAAYVEFDYDFAVARLLTNGQRDLSFSGDGRVTTPIGLGEDRARSVAVLQEGKIIAAGFTFGDVNYDAAVVSYLPNGSLDTSFTGDGIVTTNIGQGENSGLAVALQNDGKIVVAGNCTVGEYYAVAVARYHMNQAPVLGGIAGTVGYTLNAAAIALAPNATATDSDSANLLGGKLTIAVTAGAHSSNRLEIGGTVFTVDASNNLRRSGVIIGKLNSGWGVGATKFEVTFNPSATVGYAQQLIRAIRFRTVGSTLDDDRVVSFTLSDGDGGTSLTHRVTVDVA